MDIDRKGSLDYCEFIIDPKNKDTIPSQICGCIQYYMDELKDEDWSMFRHKMLTELKKIRARAGRK